jgi:H+/Cl- antiporter ClcA
VTITTELTSAAPGEQVLLTRMARIARTVLLVGIVQGVCVGLSERSDNASGPFLMLGAVCAIWYAILQLIHLRYFTRHRDLVKPKNLRRYYWPALVLAIVSVIAGTFGLLPGIGVKIGEVLQVGTLTLTFSWFHLANRVRFNSAAQAALTTAP